MDINNDIMSSRVVLKGKEVETDKLEKAKWKKEMSDHNVSVLFLPLANVLYIIYSLAKSSIIARNFLIIFCSTVCELSLPSITLSVYGPVPSTKYLNPSTVPLLLLRWL